MPTRAARLAALPAGLAPRGLSREEAAAYIGVSPTNFDKIVAAGDMPRPKAIGGRRLWDRLDLDSAFSALPDAPGAARDPAGGDVWDRASP